VPVLLGSRGGISSNKLLVDFVGVLDIAMLLPPPRIGNVCDDLTGAGPFDDILPVGALAAVGVGGINVLLLVGIRQIGGDEVATGIGESCDGLTVSRVVLKDSVLPLFEVKEGGFRGIGGAFF